MAAKSLHGFNPTPALRRTPIVFLTALVTKAETTSGLRIQGHPFLAKPIGIPDLSQALKKICLRMHRFKP